jgi:Protein of unknown function (DUF2568)
MSGLRAITLTVRFLVELALLAALAFWGFVAGSGVMAFVLGIGAPAFAAIVWGLFIAPRARYPVALPVRVLIEVALFALAAVGLAASGRALLGIGFGVLAVSTSVLNAAQEAAGTPPGMSLGR